MDITLHIGLHKTGTTSIQEHLLAGTPGYLGKSRAGHTVFGDNTHQRALQELAVHHQVMAPAEVERRTSKWIDSVRHAAGIGTGRDHLAVSAEGLSRWPDERDYHGRPFHPMTRGAEALRPRRHPIPVAEFLQRYFLPMWHLGTVRVVITLRRQPEWLASRYAEASDRLPGASQADFERRVRRLLDQNDPIIDWNGIVSDLHQAVGPDHVHVLFSEEMDHPDYWKRLRALFRVPSPTDSERADLIEPRENVREAATPDTWTLQKRKRRSDFTKVLLRGHPVFRSVGPVGTALCAAAQLASPAIDPLLDRGRASTITLTDDLRSDIMTHCDPLNRQLAQRLPNDLIQLGYHTGFG